MPGPECPAQARSLRTAMHRAVATGAIFILSVALIGCAAGEVDLRDGTAKVLSSNDPALDSPITPAAVIYSGTSHDVISPYYPLDTSTPYWTNTGVELQKGDRVRISVKGGFNWTDGVEDRSLNPAGLAESPKERNAQGWYILPQAPTAGVMARIGCDVRYVGVGLEYDARESGTLLLAINEEWRRGAWSDNRGILEVTVATSVDPDETR